MTPEVQKEAFGKRTNLKKVKFKGSEKMNCCFVLLRNAMVSNLSFKFYLLFIFNITTFSFTSTTRQP